MKKIVTLLLFLFFCTTYVARAQEDVTVDTVYYDSKGMGVPNKAFADFYRVMIVPTDSLCSSIYRDFYLSGKIKRDGRFFKIDKQDDRNSVFDGEYKTYYENGLIEYQGTFKNGKLEGMRSFFDKDGMSCAQLEFRNGEPITDYYTLSDEYGVIGKFSLNNDSAIWESPSPEEKIERYIEGEAWPYYFKNGLLVSINVSKIKEYGKYYRVDMVISNYSMETIDFNPNEIKAILTDSKGDQWYLGVFTAEQYMKRVQRKQNAAMIMSGIALGLSAASAGYSYGTAVNTSYYSGGYGRSRYGGTVTTYSTIRTYDAAAAFQAQMLAGQSAAAIDRSLLLERKAIDKGYLKLTTIERGESISGYILIERKSGDLLNVVVPVYEASYGFDWDVKKK